MTENPDTPELQSPTPVTPPVRTGVIGSVLVVIGCLMWLGPVGVLMLVVPKFKSVFEDFDVMLPDLTIQMLMISDFLKERFYIAAPLMAAVFGLLFAWALLRRSRACFVLGVILTLCSMVAMVLIVIALFLPFSSGTFGMQR